MSAVTVALVSIACSSVPIPKDLSKTDTRENSEISKGEKKEFSSVIDISEQLPLKIAEAVCSERALRRATRLSTQRKAKLLSENFKVMTGDDGVSKVKCTIEAKIWQ